MSLRINPDLLGGIVEGLTQARRREDRALGQIASGRRLSSLSDDPAASAALVQDQAQRSAADQFTQNVSTLRGMLEVADSTLNSAVLALTRAIALGVQGANGTLTLENRRALAKEVRGLKEQVMGMANLSFQGRYLFAGTAVTTQPFVTDTASASGVRYQGNAGVNQVEVGPGESIAVNLPGDRIFSDPAGDVFQGLNDLAAALESGSGIEAATAVVRQAFDHLNTQRPFYGATLKGLESTEQFLNREKFELSRHETDVAGADLAQASVDLLQARNTREALLTAGGKISQLSLLDFLR